MLYFNCDYMTGAHPEVMRRLVETNLLHTAGYGDDPFCREARQLILDTFGIRRGEVYFMEGGTQTNLAVISRLLDHCDGVIATPSAHISVHEAGAIEASGHKVIQLPEHDGKLSADDIKEYIEAYRHDDTRFHMVRPGLVYITYPTELGTLYTVEELAGIYNTCRYYGIPLYIDGARLAYGLAAADDIQMADFAEFSDIFYVGGTKCGALFGEAVVTKRPELFPRFFSFCKSKGAVLAKGRLLGVQFATLFKDGLYLRIGAHAVEMAKRVRRILLSEGFFPYIDSPTNQQFFILPNDVIKRLREYVSFDLWGPLREKKTPVRFVTDWSTTPEAVEELGNILRNL